MACMQCEKSGMPVVYAKRSPVVTPPKKNNSIFGVLRKLFAPRTPNTPNASMGARRSVRVNMAPQPLRIRGELVVPGSGISLSRGIPPIMSTPGIPAGMGVYDYRAVDEYYGGH